jgi:hypothetical protein
MPIWAVLGMLCAVPATTAAFAVGEYTLGFVCLAIVGLVVSVTKP